MSDRLMELDDLGYEKKPSLSAETAEKQWKTYAREYRVVGRKAEMLAALKDEIITAIMLGDLEIFEEETGIAVKQNLIHRPNGAPESVTYHSPNSANLVAAGTDVVTLTVRWRRIAASLARAEEGQMISWFYGQDLKNMELVVQLFT